MVSGIIGGQGFELIDIAVAGRKGSQVIRFVIDRDGGIGVDDCVRISRDISDLLEFHEEDFGLDRYRLEVSSPGTDRPLRSEGDFRRNIGRLVRIDYSGENGSASVEGRVMDVSEISVTIESKQQSVVVPLSSIERAQIKMEW